MRVAVIGAGPAGRHFAGDCALAGLSVILEDVMPDRLRSAQCMFTAVDTSVELATTVEDAVAQADIVIDFVPDELESKLEILSLLDRMAPPRTILCTPSQALSITDLASCTYRPDRCIMVRDLQEAAGPVYLLSSHHTSPVTQAAAASLFARLKREVLQEPDPDLPMLMKNMQDTSLAG